MTQEIEAKYSVPDEATFVRLMQLESLGEYLLEASGELLVVDRYVDTASRHLLEGGYACRLRKRSGLSLVTVKALGEAEGAVHRRLEYEMEVAGETGPDRWPPGPARDLVLALAEGRPLVELFVVRQRRSRRAARRGPAGPVAAELSLDLVEFEAGGRRMAVRELEVEVAAAGALDDLARLSGALAPYRLRPEPLSKFARGLALLDDPVGGWASGS